VLPESVSAGGHSSHRATLWHIKYLHRSKYNAMMCLRQEGFDYCPCTPTVYSKYRASALRSGWRASAAVGTVLAVNCRRTRAIVETFLPQAHHGIILAAMKILDVPQSGSVAGVTSSRNRFGQYRRTRATPVNPNSTFQGAVRARLSVNSAAWRALTAAQRAGWNDLAASMTRTDSLGQTYSLTGFQSYCSVNNN